MNETRTELTGSTVEQILTTLRAMQSDIGFIASFLTETRDRRDAQERHQADADLAKRSQQDRDNKARW